jgi:hypothetical protein
MSRNLLNVLLYGCVKISKMEKEGILWRRRKRKKCYKEGEAYLLF